MSGHELFITVDDDPVNNMLSKIIITKFLPSASVQAFTSAEAALGFIAEDSARIDKIILFLDINMPGMDGWGFLDQFEQMDQKHKQKVTIYMLSSSLDKNDVQLSQSYCSVKDYLSKPLSIDKLEQVFTSLKVA